jgi:hypothetical protein
MPKIEDYALIADCQTATLVAGMLAALVRTGATP